MMSKKSLAAALAAIAMAVALTAASVEAAAPGYAAPGGLAAQGFAASAAALQFSAQEQPAERVVRDHRGYTHGKRPDAQGGVSVTHSCRWTKRCPKK